MSGVFRGCGESGEVVTIVCVMSRESRDGVLKLYMWDVVKRA